jgi:hypothetical protein
MVVCFIISTLFLREDFVVMRATPGGPQGDVFIPSNVYDSSLLTNNKSFYIHDDIAVHSHDVICCNMAHYKPRGNLLIACTHDEAMAIFLAKPSGLHCNAITGLELEKIAYMQADDLPILETLFKCFGITFRGELIKVDKIEFSRAPCIFMVANIKYVPKALVNMVSVYTYNSITPNMVERHFPQATLKQLETRVYIPGYVGPDEVMSVVTFNNVLYTSKKEITKNIDFCAQYFVDNIDKLLLLSNRFRLHDRAIFYIKVWQEELTIDKSSQPVLEQFSVSGGFESGWGKKGDYIEVISNENVDGFLKMPEKVFQMPGDSIEGIPLVIGDLVRLRHQTEKDENGDYIVSAFRSDGGTSLEMKDGTETQEVEEDESFFCVTSPNLLYKHECISPVHPLSGQPKLFMDVWDGPCKYSSQCPFFKYDERKGEYVGKCVDGLCEMPSGYTRIGFRKYINQ